MYKITKFKWEDRHRIFVSSDWHNFHDPNWPEPIWKQRGYGSPQESVDDVREKVNARVGADDYLFYLGDGFLNASDEQALEFFKSINCRNVFYHFGNHESQVYRIYKQEVKRQYDLEETEVYPLRIDNVVFVGNHSEVRVGRQLIVLNHFPLRIWNKNNKGSWCLSGHSHGSDQGRRPERPLGKAMDCSWEIKNDIWSFDEIADVMNTKEIEWLDHHDAKTT